MKLELRCSSDGEFGFVETYKPYSFRYGAISIKAVANVGDYLSEPYVFRGGLFIPARTIDEEMGIFRYIKAKKPIYSVLGKGNVILDMRVAYDLNKLSYIKEKSYFNIYGVVKDSLICEKEDGIHEKWYVDIRKLTSSNSDIDEWLDKLGKKIALMGCDKKDFLKSRMKG